MNSMMSPCSPLPTPAPTGAARGDGAAHVPEIVDFRLVEGKQSHALFRWAKATGALLTTHPEVLCRMLVQGTDRPWTDVVEWTPLKTAERAAKEVMAEPGLVAFGAMIEGASVAMRHAPPLRRMG